MNPRILLENFYEIDCRLKEYKPSKTFQRHSHTNMEDHEEDWNPLLYKSTAHLFNKGYEMNQVLDYYNLKFPEPPDERDIATIESAYAKTQEDGSVISTEDYRPERTPPEIKFREMLRPVFNSTFKVVLTSTGVPLPNEILPGNILKPINTKKIEMWVAKSLKNLELKYRNSHISAIANSLILDSNPISERQIKPIAFPGESSYCRDRIDINPEPGDTPAFDSFIKRCSNAQAFLAFIWSILEEKSYLHQYLYIQGEGGDGKSTIINFIQKLAKNSFGAASVPNGSDKHWESLLVGKRVIVFADLTNSNFLKTDRFKSLTGGDPISINEKFKPPYTITPKLKILISSNNDPLISSQKADTRRMIYCKLKTINGDYDPKFIDKLWSERSAVLFKCRQAYEDLTLNHGAIKSEETEIKSIIQDNEIEFEIIFEKYFIYSQGDIITREKFYKAVMEGFKELGVSTRQYKKFQRSLRSKGINTDYRDPSNNHKNSLKNIRFKDYREF